MLREDKYLGVVVLENAQLPRGICRVLSTSTARRGVRRSVGFQIVTFRHLISSTARPVASLISSKSIPSYGSGILILVLAAARVLKKSQVVSVQAEA